MFNSRAKYFNNIFILFKKIILLVSVLFISVLFFLNSLGLKQIIPNYLYLDLENQYMKLLTNILFFGSMEMALFLIVSLLDMFAKNKFMKIYSKDCAEIINSTNLPKKIPKVLYIYTCHNDLSEERLLQNMNQSYANLEIWVSDGSNKTEWRNKIKDFCSKNKINLFQLPPEGSKNKADNLNKFLAEYKGTYDYLLIGDAKEIFHPDFINNAIKFFYSNKIKNLSYIVPLNVGYRINGIFSNTIRIHDSLNFYQEIGKSFSLKNIHSLLGRSFLISKESFLKSTKNKGFDDVDLEDFYLEYSLIENDFFGLALPFSNCYFEPDKDVFSHFNRLLKMNDWIIRWWKLRNRKTYFIKYNEKFTEWYKENSIYLFKPFFWISSLLLFDFFVLILIENWEFAFFKNILFWIFISFFILLILIKTISKFIIILKINFNIVDTICYPLVIILYNFALIVPTTISWFKSIFMNKYSNFIGDGDLDFYNNRKKIRFCWVSFTLVSTLIVLFNSLFFIFAPWYEFKWIIIFFNTFVGVIWLSYFSYLILHYINFVPYNLSYDDKKWLECKNII